ncbi:hypothetical protein MTO96_033770 [Rhipicephalus appendiculatus]
MFGRELLCPLDLLKRETDIQIFESQETLNKSRRFTVGERVLIRQFLSKSDWIEGELLRRLRSWLVKSDRGKVRRHPNHMRKTSQTGQATQSPTDWSAADDLSDTTPKGRRRVLLLNELTRPICRTTLPRNHRPQRHRQ